MYWVIGFLLGHGPLAGPFTSATNEHRAGYDTALTPGTIPIVWA